jgi:hypothetical protein
MTLLHIARQVLIGSLLLWPALAVAQPLSGMPEQEPMGSPDALRIEDQRIQSENQALDRRAKQVDREVMHGICDDCN